MQDYTIVPEAPGLHYQGIAVEGTTEYIFTHTDHYSDDETAIAAGELGLQEAQEVRAEEGGFPLDAIVLYCTTPRIRIVKAYDAFDIYGRE
jgi:hypothetical protein